MKLDCINAIVDLSHSFFGYAYGVGEILREVFRQGEVMFHEWAVNSADPLVFFVGAIKVANIAPVFSVDAYFYTSTPGGNGDFQRSQISRVNNRGPYLSEQAIELRINPKNMAGFFVESVELNILTFDAVLEVGDCRQ